MKGSLLPLFLATAVVVVASVMSVCAASVESPITMNGEAAWPQEAVAAALQDTPGFQVASIRGYKLLDTFERSQLYEVEADGYADPVKLVVLRGSRLQMGTAYGKMLAKSVRGVYTTFVENLIPKESERALLELFVDWQWDTYLSQQTPQEFKDEIQGIKEGGEMALTSFLDRYVSRVITLANSPGDADDFIEILWGEFQDWLRNITSTSMTQSLPVGSLDKEFQSIRKAMSAMQCSMFGVWGSRTKNGNLFTGRNLDWTKDTGIYKFKLVTVYHPDGKIPHATVGFEGFVGALTGMSKAGLTVHEANLEESVETFLGFPWVLRLRYIMENANNLAEARTLWEHTNNTVGFNHMVGSSSDAPKGPAALVMETEAGYTAYFYDNDPREAEAMYTDAQGQTKHLGAPLKEAVFRTNHGYDPTIRKTYMWGVKTHAFQDSVQRYFLLSQTIADQGTTGSFDWLQAVNTTSVLGQKGPNYLTCPNDNSGINVLSVAFHPASSQMWAAWEDGTGPSWRAACCNTYINFDMTYWLSDENLL